MKNENEWGKPSCLSKTLNKGYVRTPQPLKPLSLRICDNFFDYRAMIEGHDSYGWHCL